MPNTEPLLRAYSLTTAELFETREIPRFTSNNNIMNVRDKMFRVGTWCNGEVELWDTGVTLDTVEGRQLAGLGDWIVKEDEGVFRIYSPIEFNQKFRAITATQEAA